MVLPLYDDNSDRRLVPIVNYVFIAINVFVFVVFQGLGENIRFTFAFSCVPQEIMTGRDLTTPDKQIEHPVTGQKLDVPGLQPTPGTVYITLLTSMFMHGGIAHLLGNMLFLWIFGDNIEDSLGHLRYIFFYLLCGVAASMAHVLTTVAIHGVESAHSQVPSLGASGAISGVLGAYLLLHPHRQVVVLMFRFLTQVPAWVAIGMWFAFQLISGLDILGEQVGGVAYAAHIGGFLAGMAVIYPFMAGRKTPDRPLDHRRRRVVRYWR